MVINQLPLKNRNKQNKSNRTDVTFEPIEAVADPGLQLRGGLGFVLLAVPAFLP